MDDHPKCKEQFTEKRTPRVVSIVYRVRHTGDNSDDVYYQKGGGGNQESRPFELVEFGERIIIAAFWRYGKVGVDTGENLEETLEDSEKMGWYASDHPKLLVPPPLVDPDPAPPHFEDSRREDADEKGEEPQASDVAKLYFGRRKRKRN